MAIPLFIESPIEWFIELSSLPPPHPANTSVATATSAIALRSFLINMLPGFVIQGTRRVPPTDGLAGRISAGARRTSRASANPVERDPEDPDPPARRTVHVRRRHREVGV